MVWVLITTVVLIIVSIILNYQKANNLKKLNSLPCTEIYYINYGVLLSLIPNALLILCWALFNDGIANLLLNLDSKNAILITQIDQYLNGVKLPFSDEVINRGNQKNLILNTINTMFFILIICTAIIALAYSYYQTSKAHRARVKVEAIVKKILFTASLISILTTIGIIFSMLFEAIKFFNIIPLKQFLFGIEWHPQIAIRDDQIGSTGAFGFLPVFAGTLLISLIAMMISVPIGLFSAIYMAEYASDKVRAISKPILEILAGIPTVVYGFFAVLVISPAIRGFGRSIELDVSSESALVAGLVMGIMLIPFISSLSDDVITAVPRSLRDGSYGLGATKSETIKFVVIPAALPGIASSILLAFSRAIGETMIVVMAAGLAANLTINPLEAVTTITGQMVSLLVGDQEFDSAKTLAAFALGLTLFIITLMLNVFALHLVNKHREKYD